MGRALGLSAGGSRLPNFLATKAIKPLVGAELEEKLSKPLIFQWDTGGHEKPPGVIYGFDVTLLIDVCRIVIQAEAEGKLGKRHDNIVRQAHIILNASAKSGIKQLVPSWKDTTFTITLAGNPTLTPTCPALTNH